MMRRLKDKLLAIFDSAVYHKSEDGKTRVALEVQIDIRDRLETLCAIERKRLTIEEKRLAESRVRNVKIAELAKTIDGLPQPDVEAEVEASP